MEGTRWTPRAQAPRPRAPRPLLVPPQVSLWVGLAALMVSLWTGLLMAATAAMVLLAFPPLGS
jgi:hypothetical protein